MKEKLQAIREEALAQIEQAGALDKLNDVRVNFLGKKGKLTAVLKSMKDVAPEERPVFGQLVNDTRTQIESILEDTKKKLEAQANQSATAVQKIATAGESLKSAGDKVSSAGEKHLPASAAVTALGVAAVKTDSDFDSSMSQVAAVSGATGDDFDKLRAKAREIGAKTKFSAYEATIMNNLTGEVKLSGKPSKTGLPANHRG